MRKLLLIRTCLFKLTFFLWLSKFVRLLCLIRMDKFASQAWQHFHYNNIHHSSTKPYSYFFKKVIQDLFKELPSKVKKRAVRSVIWEKLLRRARSLERLILHLESEVLCDCHSATTRSNYRESLILWHRRDTFQRHKRIPESYGIVKPFSLL